MSEQAIDIELERMEAAARWLVQLRESPDDERLIAEWLSWCDADDENLETFQRIQDTWRTAGNLQAEPESRPLRRLRPRRAGVFARAAAVAFLLLGGGAVLTVTQIFGGGRTLSTEVATHASSDLPDGSHIELGALSRMRVKYSEAERRLTLYSGEAFFEVAPDPARPFVVDAGDVTITAVGTAFNVRRADERVVVTVNEGRVRLQSDAGRIWDVVAPAADRPEQTVEAGAGEQATYTPREERIVTAAVADPEAATAWRRGVLKFVHEPLDAVVSDLNRYSHRQIELGDSRLRELRYTGTVFSGSLDDWLKAVENVFPVRVERIDENRVVLELLD